MMDDDLMASVNDITFAYSVWKVSKNKHTHAMYMHGTKHNLIHHVDPYYTAII